MWQGRSLNSQLSIRDTGLAAQVRAQFETDLTHRRRITHADTAGFRHGWTRLKQRLAYFLLSRLELCPSSSAKGDSWWVGLVR